MRIDGSLPPRGFRPDERSASNGQHSSLVLSQDEGFLVRRWPAGEASQGRITITELVLVACAAGMIVIGWVSLLLAQFGSLTLRNLLLSLSPIAIASVALALRKFGFRISDFGFWPPLPESAIRNPQSAIRNLALAGILALAAILYTPPADYAPAFLDAGWYTNAGALIARTGSLTHRPPVLENLPATHRALFIRTYHDVKASLPQFPDRHDMGFFNLAFTVDLGRGGAVAPYHPPLASIWITILRLVGGPKLGAYAAPLFGLLFVLAVYAAGRAIFGPNVGLVGALLTALSAPVVYYARTPFAELLAGTLIWAGIYAMSRFAVATTRLVSSPLLLCSSAPLLPCSPAPLLLCSSAPLLLLAGLAFGAALLTKIESFMLLPTITLFWLIWLRRKWATRRQFAVFLVPFGILLSHAVLLYTTVLRPYAVLNGYGIWSKLIAALSQPAIWVIATALYIGVIGTLIALRRGLMSEIGDWRLGIQDQSPIPNLSRSRFRSKGIVRSPSRPGFGNLGRTRNLQSPISNLQTAASLLILAAAGIALLATWQATQANSPSTLSSLATLTLFLTPLGLCLGIVGLSTLVAHNLNKRTAFLVITLGTAGAVTVLMPAISENVSYLYTVRRQLPVVLPALLLLTSYQTLQWAGLAGEDSKPTHKPAALRRALAMLLLALLVIYFTDIGRPLLRHQELAGSSAFVAKLAQSFESGDVVLFESTDRGAHVGRFAAPLWAEHGVSAILLSSTYPPQERLAEVIERWHQQGRRVFFVSQSEPPPFTLPNFAWNLWDRQHWAGSVVAAKMEFPPETWILEIPFYIYEVKKRN